MAKLGRMFRCRTTPSAAIDDLFNMLKDPNVDETGVPTQLQQLFTTYNTLDLEDLNNVQAWQVRANANPAYVPAYNQVDSEYRRERRDYGLDEAIINKMVRACHKIKSKSIMHRC